MTGKKIRIVGKGIAALLLLVACFSALAASKPVHIGILVPMEHAAMQEIVEGFKKTVSARFADVHFNVQNAQGDLKLQRSIIELFIGQKVDLIVPVGTSATRMALSLVKDKPIVSLAAKFSEAERQKKIPRNITGILDEISSRKKLDFIRQLMPDIKNLTLIYHSANEKNYEEIEELKLYSKTLNLKLQTLMIQTLPELEMAAGMIFPEAEAILVGKDHLIASGIRMLVPVAVNRGIPLVASDEGSVLEGASVALGVREKEIGEEGGRLAVKVLEGHPIAGLPMQEIQSLAVFYNPFFLQRPVDLSALQGYARKNNCELIKREKS